MRAEIKDLTHAYCITALYFWMVIITVYHWCGACKATDQVNVAMGLEPIEYGIFLPASPVFFALTDRSPDISCDSST